MILAFEITWSGLSHAEGNNSRLLTILRAFPDASVSFHAEASHLREVFLPDQAPLRRVARHEITLAEQFRDRPQMVSWLRFWQEWLILARAFRAARREPCLVVMMSSTSTGIVAARLAGRCFLPKGSLLQVLLHGELNAITGWRSHNPLLRALDYRAALGRRGVFPTRYVVLEENISAAWLQEMPELAPFVDVMPHQVPVFAPSPAAANGEALRIGLVGQATRDKGIDVFLEVATRMKRKLGNKIEFHHIGRVPRGADLAPFHVLDSTPSYDGLAREEFDRRINQMHFVFLPLDGNYYRLSASGALLDAVARLKPVIISDLPISRQYFDAYGPIGYCYRDANEIDDLILDAQRALTDGRYAAMQDNLRKAASSRDIDSSAGAYRGIVVPHMPSLS